MSRYLLSEPRNTGNHGHPDTQRAPAARALPRRAKGALGLVVLQMLGVWAAAWAALASTYAWLH
jgi:hypothetical protein